MLTKEQNELMCRVGRGTPMGENLRRYWWPVAASQDLPVGGRACTPRRVPLLGEHFVLFRGEDGRLGLIDDRCPHRGASMVVGVVEGCGLRCIYHGWKMGLDGKVEDAPNVSRGDRSGGPMPGVRTNRYGVREAGGIIWAYVGPAELEPPFMDYRWFGTPPENHWVAFTIFEANFVQVMEASVDPSHLAILHQDALHKASVALESASNQSALNDLTPEVEFEKTDFGFRLYTIRGENAEENRLRPTAYVAPGSFFITASSRPTAGALITVTPLDDYRSLQLLIRWDEEQQIGLDPLKTQMQYYLGVSAAKLEATGLGRDHCDRPGKPALENGFLQDRAAIAAGTSFSGIPDFVPEDAVMAAAQGPLVDRSREHLVKADLGIVEMRRSLIESAKRVEGGEPPVGLGRQVDYYAIAAYEYLLPRAAGWQNSAPTHAKPVTTVN